MNDSSLAQPNCAAALISRRPDDRIRREVLGPARAKYGGKIGATLSHQSEAEFDRGYEWTNLPRMMKVAEAFPDEEIVATLWRQFSWPHFRELLP